MQHSINSMIRNANLADLDALMEIERECFDCDTIENETVYRERIQYFPDGFLVLEEADKPIGFICSEIWHDSETLTPDMFALEHSIAQSLDRDGNTLYISSLAVLKRYRGYGFGKKLFQTLITQIAAKYHGITEAVLLVGSTWHAAQKLYEQNGFKVCSSFTDFFGGEMLAPYHGIVMKKQMRH